MNDYDHNDTNGQLDTLLRDWHHVNAERAEAGRERLLVTLRRETQRAGRIAEPRPGLLATVRHSWFRRYAPAAASITLLVVIASLLVPTPNSTAYAGEVAVPDGGRLDAIDENGQIIGACPLEHTDVDVAISGRFARVTLQQSFLNPYDRKIEAVYTFPLSHRGAVDRMTMTIGDRVIVGEVKERAEARAIYEQAREQGYVASLLEQERPNIFTQSIANIEPGVQVVVEISYVEMVQERDGRFLFDFPMTVSPRYIPGNPVHSPDLVPAELTLRHGVVELGPCDVTVGDAGETDGNGLLDPGKLRRLLERAQPVQVPEPTWFGETPPKLWYRFSVEYADGSSERGTLHVDGTGQLNGRWFWIDPTKPDTGGLGFNADTDIVPDASRITPMPVRPDERAGHDLSLTVTIDTGGPGIVEVDSELHSVVRLGEVPGDDGDPKRVVMALMDQKTIPNRDFVLSWAQNADAVEEAVFVHHGEYGDFSGGFISLVLAPPARVEDADVPTRELVFVLDCSGSMEDGPIEKAKAVMRDAIATMRPTDRFNVITFNESYDCLWPKPQPNTDANRNQADAYVASRVGGGGTEMTHAMTAALEMGAKREELGMSIETLRDQPADGREVQVVFTLGDLGPRDGDRRPFDIGHSMHLVGDLAEAVDFEDSHVEWIVWGTWELRDGDRCLLVDRVAPVERESEPFRAVFFLSDGEFGDDPGLIEMVRGHSEHTHVFAIGIGNSPNRNLIDGIAKAGRGASDFVNLEADTNEAAARFARRIANPVLTNIEIELSDGLEIDWAEAIDAVPDLFDEAPIVLHGRYTKAAKGTLTVRGRTGQGAYERSIDLELSDEAPDHDVIATLWARQRVDELKKTSDVAGIVSVGTSFGIMSEHTSFVAVEKSRITIEGETMLVAIPIEFPSGQAWHGTFGGATPIDLVRRFDAERAVTYAVMPPETDARFRHLATQRNAFDNETWYRARGRDVATPFGSEAAQPADSEGEPVDTGATDETEAPASTETIYSTVTLRATDVDPAQVIEMVEMVAAAARENEVLPEHTWAEYENSMAEARRYLADGDLDRARQEAVRAQAELNLRRQTLPDSDRLGADAAFFEENMKRIEQLEQNMDYDAAIMVADEILALDPQNARALAFHESLEAAYKQRSLTLYSAAEPVMRGVDVLGAEQRRLLGRGVSQESIVARVEVLRELGESIQDPQTVESMVELRDLVLYGENAGWGEGREVGGDQFGAYMYKAALTQQTSLGLPAQNTSLDVAIAIDSVHGQTADHFVGYVAAPPETLAIDGLGVLDYHDLTRLNVTEGEVVLGARLYFEPADMPVEEPDTTTDFGLDTTTRGIEAVTEDYLLRSESRYGYELSSIEGAPALIVAGDDDGEVPPDARLRLEAIVDLIDADTEAYGEEARADWDAARAAIVQLVADRLDIAAVALEAVEEDETDEPKLTIAFHPSDDPFFMEKTVILARYLVADGHVDQATLLARMVVHESKKFELGQRVLDTLVDAGASERVVEQRLDELADEARETIVRVVRESLLKAMRMARETQVLDAILLPFARGSGFPDDFVQAYDGPWPDGCGYHEGGALVTILVADPADLDELRDVPVRIVDVSRSTGVVVGSVPLGRFAELAQVENVRRVEPLMP